MKQILTLLIILIASVIGANAEKYKGTIGPYSITMTLNFDGDALASYRDVTGSYIYDKAKNRLNLSGEYNAPWSERPGLYLDEYTLKGKKSGEWKLKESDNGGLEGTFINTTNGKKFKVILHSVD